MIRTKSYREQPFTKEELSALNRAELISESHSHYDAIRYAIFSTRYGDPQVVFRFPNKFGASVVRRNDYKNQKPLFDIFFLNQSGFLDMTTPWGSWRSFCRPEDVMIALDEIENLPLSGPLKVKVVE